MGRVVDWFRGDLVYVIALDLVENNVEGTGMALSSCYRNCVAVVCEWSCHFVLDLQVARAVFSIKLTQSTTLHLLY
jgi:hypothetical protein